MKYLFFTLIISILLGFSVCCIPPPKTPIQRERELIQLIKDKTVALIIEGENNKIYPYCGGVWVAKDLILTAHHCLDRENLILKYKILSDETFEPHFAIPLKTDITNDLMVLKVVGDIPLHPIAKITKDKWIGEKVHIVGHPEGLWWSYFPGIISSWRNNFNYKTKEKQKLIQISAPIWKGNSGGGAFDDEGNLIGICSWILADAPMVSFFIRQDAINDFLKDIKNN